MAASPEPDATPVVVAEIGKAVGLKGEVRVWPFTADPAALPGYAPFTDGQGRVFEVAACRAALDHLIMRFKGFGDRTAAEALNRVTLMVPRARLPVIEAEDEFYLADLIGLAAMLPDGSPVGHVQTVENHGAGDILVIAREGLAPLLLAFTRAAVPVVDMAGRRLVIAPPDEVDAEDADKPGRRP
jgi:16S rRNA processing protein RimM